MASQGSSSLRWDELVTNHLISAGVLSGIAILTKTGDNCVLSYGKLASHSDQDWHQFTSLFTDTSEKVSDTEVPKLCLTFEREVPFIVFHKSQCSLYATSAGNLHGLVVCSFPLGVIVCTSEPPTPMSKAVSTVETFVSMLRR